MKKIFLSIASLMLLISCGKTNVDSCCTGSAQVATVDSAYIAVPDMFTPNGDGINDLLYARSKNISSVKFIIKDFWGKVFETNDVKIGWNGSYKGKPAKEKSYSFTLDATTTSGQSLSLKGDICLIVKNCVNGKLPNCNFDSPFVNGVFDKNIPSGESIVECK